MPSRVGLVTLASLSAAAVLGALCLLSAGSSASARGGGVSIASGAGGTGSGAVSIATGSAAGGPSGGLYIHVHTYMEYTVYMY